MLKQQQQPLRGYDLPTTTPPPPPAGWTDDDGNHSSGFCWRRAKEKTGGW